MEANNLARGFPKNIRDVFPPVVNTDHPDGNIDAAYFSYTHNAIFLLKGIRFWQVVGSRDRWRRPFLPRNGLLPHKEVDQHWFDICNVHPTALKLTRWECCSRDVIELAKVCICDLLISFYVHILSSCNNCLISRRQQQFWILLANFHRGVLFIYVTAALSFLFSFLEQCWMHSATKTILKDFLLLRYSENTCMYNVDKANKCFAELLKMIFDVLTVSALCRKMLSNGKCAK